MTRATITLVCIDGDHSIEAEMIGQLAIHRSIMADPDDAETQLWAVSEPISGMCLYGGLASEAGARAAATALDGLGNWRALALASLNGELMPCADEAKAILRQYASDEYRVVSAKKSDVMLAAALQRAKGN